MRIEMNITFELLKWNISEIHSEETATEQHKVIFTK